MAVMSWRTMVGRVFNVIESCFGSDAYCTLAGGATQRVEGRGALARANDLIMEVERGEYDEVGVLVRNMTNIYNSLLHGKGEHARAEGVSSGGGGVGRMDAMLMLLVDGSEGSGYGIGGGVGAQVVTVRPARRSFCVVLKAYADLVEWSHTFKERQQCADRIKIVKIMERKSGIGGNGVALSVNT